jgi:hypothetical protein
MCKIDPFKTGLICCLATFSGVAQGASHWVTNAAQFNALPALNAGDAVVLQDGTYGALNKTIVSTISDDAVAQINPVLIFAQTPGGAKITAPSQITLQGRGIALAGLDFIEGSGMLENGDGDPAWVIRTDNNSRYITLSNIRFLNCTAGDTYGNWLAIYGFNHRIEYCSFEGKNEPVANATVMFKREYDEAGPSTPRNHVLRRCWFGPREVSVTSNGYETIRIGDSSSQIYEMQTTIEENVFYRSIWRADGLWGDSEPEIISNKSAGNKIRHNTFLESFGQVTLRHGDRATVEGNFFLGGGAYGEDGNIVIGATNVYQSGVRIIGMEHVIRNNYFQNLRGTNLRAAICLMAGDPDFNDGDGTTGDNGYETADHAQILHNTFVGCAEINLGYREEIQPQDVKIYNNAWQGANSNNAIVRDAAFVIGAAGGNYIYEANGKYGWTGLTNGVYTSSASPKINEAFNGYLIPASDSPLLNAALNAGFVSNDVRGLVRSGYTNDIGCFERETTGIGRGPMLRAEVGPLFDGGPEGTYPPDFYAVKYALTVNSGTGSGSYTNTQVVAITASNIAGKAFSQWIGDTQYVNNVTYTNALVTMSTNAVTLTATYTDVIDYPATYALTVNSGDGDGSYTNGQQVTISADAPAIGKVFVEWIGDVQYVANVSASNTTVTMPTNPVTLTASYTDSALVYINETYEGGTLGAALATNLTTVAQGSGLIGPDNVADLNDNSTSSSNGAGYLEYNAGASAPGAMYISFDLLNINPPVSSNPGNTASNPITFSVGLWNNTAGYKLNANATRAFGIEVHHDGTNANLKLRRSSTAIYTNSYNQAALLSFKIWVNDNDTNTLSYTRPDTGAPATLGADSFVVYLNNALLGVTAAGYTNQFPLSVGNAVLGRLGFYTASAVTADFQIDNLYVVGLGEEPAVSHTLTSSAGTGGAVSPASTNVPAGNSATFVITASNYYRITLLTTNGSAVTGMSFDNSSTTTNFTWSNVQASGVLAATFTNQVANDPANTPHSWLAVYGLTNSGATFDQAAAADQDSDGLAAWQEYLADTNPTNAASRLAVTSLTIVTNQVRLTWTGGSNAWQYVEYCNSLTDTNGWKAVYTNTPPTAVTNTLFDTGAGNTTNRFYRIKAGR